MGSKLNMSQQMDLAVTEVNHILGCASTSMASRLRAGITPLFGACEAAS